MKTLIFEPFSGAAGDMILGSLIDLGADAGKIRQAVESTVDVTLSINRTVKKSIEATNVHVNVPHEHHSRHYYELVEVIRKAGLPEAVEKDVLAVFEIMGQAESKVHGHSLEHLHFHEVGQNDALADVIGSCVAIHDMGPGTILTTPINVGGGTVRAAHGLMAVPAPATLEILKASGLSFYSRGDRELLTPTGTAILAHFATPIENIPLGRALATGYGAGDADTEDPNVLRTVLMDLRDDTTGDLVEILETNVDDVSGEVLGNLFDRLLELGAKDVTVTPVTMKKGRPGHVIRVVTAPHDSASLAREIMKETGTLGIRVLTARHRFTATRRMDRVSFALGGERFETPVKIAADQSGEVLHVSAEYENCRKIAGTTNLPLKEVIRRAEEEAWKRFGR